MRSRALAALLALGLSACSSALPNAPQPLGVSAALDASAAGAYRVAPYVDMLSWPPPQLATYAARSGNDYYTLAFVQSYQGTQCTGAWGGSVLPSDPTNGAYFAKQFADIRKAGGDGILSFGGAAGTDLASVCTSAGALAAAIESLVDTYRVTHLDFDVEGNGPYDASSVALRSQALRLVEEHYSSAGKVLAISLTLPVLPTGMPSHVLGVVRSALEAGVKIAIVNVMAMDYGNGIAPRPQGKMGTYAIDAATHSVEQLRRIGFPFGSNAYASIGVTPMIGVNDVSDEIFELSDAAQLAAWAKAHGLGRLTFWAAQRDKTCPGGANPHASDTCSGIVQNPYAFGKAFAADAR